MLHIYVLYALHMYEQVCMSCVCLQDDLALKQKRKEDAKKMQEAKAKASQKGPMGTVSFLNNAFVICFAIMCRWWRNQEKWEEVNLLSAHHDTLLISPVPLC